MNYTCMERSLPASSAVGRGRGERRIALGPNDPVSVETARGTVVRCERGSIWLTQEGRWRDYILVAGASYVSLDDGKIVLNSQDSASAASVYRIDLAATAGMYEPQLYLDSGVIARAERKARRARAVEVARWFAVLPGALSSIWRSIKGQGKPAAG